MAKSINRYFQFIGTSKHPKPSGRLWYPAADVYETPDGWLVKVDLAGVSAEDVEIGNHGNVLQIAGCHNEGSCTVGFHIGRWR